MFLLLALPVAALAAFAVDDECREQSCALSALQRRARLTGEVEEASLESESEAAAGNASFRYCEDSCWLDYGFIKGDCRCDKHHGWYMWICWKRHGHRIKTEYGHQFNCHGLSKPAPPPPPPPPKAPPPPPPPVKTYASKEHPEYKVTNKLLLKNSSAPLMTFHLFRVQSDTNYSCCANADLTTAGAAMFYLHNEIVFHAKSRAGTNFQDPKTRIVRYKVMTRATQPLFDIGMNFGAPRSEPS
ncbi:unnamed protein product [Effrenium voratum]|nr:unnamed protein product [Effrenium voratum]